MGLGTIRAHSAFQYAAHRQQHIRSTRTMKRAAGFTLIEVLGAMALLALLLLGVYSGIRTATHTVQVGTAKIEQLDEVRSAQQFLRRELAQAMAQAIAHDDNGNNIYFVGSEQ